MKNYVTDELEIAAFLRATGHTLLEVTPTTSLSDAMAIFTFEPRAETAVKEYKAGASLPVRDVFKAYRRLLKTVQEVKDYRELYGSAPKAPDLNS